MKNYLIHRITSLVLAFLMFSSSMGFAVNVHYCKGSLKSLNLIGEAKSCHDAGKTCPRHKTDQKIAEETDNNCCSNKTIIVDDLDEDFNFSISSQLDLQEQIKKTCDGYQVISTSSIRNYISPFSDKKVQYNPRDIYVLLERFLI